MPTLADLMNGGWNPDVSRAGVRPGYGLQGASIQPAQQSAYEPTLAPGQTRSRESLRDLLMGVIQAAAMMGAPAVPVLTPKTLKADAAARVRPGHEAEFKEWFGEGQPRANAYPDGSPMPLYHGTTADFSEFRPGQGGAAGPGIYLSKTPGLSNNFAGSREGGNVRQVYARGRFLKMPFNEAINAKEWGARARAEGYDGLDTGLGELVVFDPANIKSATGNRGTYSRSSADIRE